MISLNTIIYDCLATIGGTDLLSDDSVLSNEHVAYLANNNRAFLLRQDANKGRSLSDNIIQVLPCVDVSQIDVSECPCTVSTDCTIMRTVSKLPKFIELYQKDLVTRVSGADLTGIGFSIIPYARASVAGTSKWTKSNTKVFLHNRYIYLINPPVLKKISISGVFEDPREASQFANCDGTPCYTDDDNYPISAHMVPTLKDLIMKDLKIQVSVPSDQRGDESQKTQPQTDR